MGNPPRILSKLEKLPVELQYAIIAEFGIDHAKRDSWPLKEWAATCRYFRSLLAPFVVRKVFLKNSGASAQLINALIDSGHGHFIKVLDVSLDWVDCFTTGNHICTRENPLRKPIADVLSNLEQLPSLDTLTLTFKWWDMYGASLVPWTLPGETSEQILEREKAEYWRVLNAKAIYSLGLNSNHTLKKLIIKDFTLKEISYYSDPGWHRFLNQLEEFEMSILTSHFIGGADFGPYSVFTAKLDKFFFDHLNNVREFRLHAHATAALGSLAPFALRSGHLPRVRRIELTNVFIHQPLLDMLIERAPEMENIKFRNVMADGIGQRSHYRDWPGQITWAHFLNSLADTNLPRLVNLDISPLKWPFDWGVVFGPWAMTDTLEGNENLAELNQIVDCNPQKLVFLYGTHDRVHKLRCNASTAFHYHIGDDHRAYERVTAIISRNNGGRSVE